MQTCGVMKATHVHDCNKCEFIGASHTDHGEIFDWYICGSNFKTIIGRYGIQGQYWSMDVDTLYRVVSQPSLITKTNMFAFSEKALVAFAMLNIWREAQT